MPNASKQNPLNMTLSIDFGGTSQTSNRDKGAESDLSEYQNFLKSTFPDLNKDQEKTLLENFSKVEAALQKAEKKSKTFARRYMQDPDKAMRQALGARASVEQKAFLDLSKKMTLTAPSSLPKPLVDKIRMGKLIVRSSQNQNFDRKHPSIFTDKARGRKKPR